jgi:hypothetical protein
VISIAYKGEPQFKLYPNPSKGDVTIAYPVQAGEVAHLKVIDAIRRGDTSFTTIQSPGEFNISNLSLGIVAWITAAKKKFIILE